MSYVVPKPGLMSTGMYQISGIPYATSSLTIPGSAGTPKEISFPYITKTVTVRNTIPTSSAQTPLRVGFSSNGVKAVEYNNFFVLNNGESYTGDWRLGKLFLLSDSASETSGSVIAELTGIGTDQMPQNHSGTSGVG